MQGWRESDLQDSLEGKPTETPTDEAPCPVSIRVWVWCWGGVSGCSPAWGSALEDARVISEGPWVHLRSFHLESIVRLAFCGGGGLGGTLSELGTQNTLKTFNWNKTENFQESNMLFFVLCSCVVSYLRAGPNHVCFFLLPK